MQFERTFTCEVFEKGKYCQREEVTFRLQAERQVELAISSEVRNSAGAPETATDLAVENLLPRDLERIMRAVREWQMAPTDGTKQAETGVVEGTCTRDGERESLDRLRVAIHSDGINVTGIADGIETTEVRIPAGPERTDGQHDSREYARLFAVSLNLALCSLERNSLDNVLDPQGEFSGPLSQPLQNRCVSAYRRGDHFDAARTACQLLEEQIRDAADQPASSHGKDLIVEALGGDDPILRMSDDGAEQNGVMQLFLGAHLGLRNPMAHRKPTPARDRYLDDFTQQHARDIIYYVDLLLQLLDSASQTE